MYESACNLPIIGRILRKSYFLRDIIYSISGKKSKPMVWETLFIINNINLFLLKKYFDCFKLNKLYYFY